VIERIASIVFGILLFIVGVGVVALDVLKAGQLHTVNAVAGILFAFAGGLCINTAKTKEIAQSIDDAAGKYVPMLGRPSLSSATQWAPTEQQKGPIQ
jgi:drug/metabolite transporter (DMT)-like permease